MLRPQGDTFRVIDSFSFSHGLYVSEFLRPAILPPLAARYPTAASKLLQIDDAWLRKGSPVSTILESFDAGQHKTVLSAAAMLPENIRVARGIRAFIIRSALVTGDAETPAALHRALWKRNSNDIGSAWLSFESFLRIGDRLSASRVLDQLERQVGSDGMIDVSKAQLALDEARFEEASRLLDGVVAREPGLDLGVGLNLARFLGRQNFPAAIKVLTDYQSRTGHRVVSDELDAPIFREFRQSAEFRAWQNGGRVDAKEASGGV
jgi:hypothetical protein